MSPIKRGTLATAEPNSREGEIFFFAKALKRVSEFA
jgi:hypothetical protein